MGWMFSLSAECGTREAAGAFRAHFQNHAWQLQDGQTHALHSALNTDPEDNVWCVVWVQGMSETGVRNEQDAQQMTEAGHRLYDLLRSAPNFRYALVGVEVDMFRTYSELLEDNIVRQTPEQFSGLVLAESIWHQLERPSGFQPFRPGYVWIPYQGEQVGA